MAKSNKLSFRSFLTNKEVEHARGLLVPSAFRATRPLKKVSQPNANNLSPWLSRVLLEKLDVLPCWLSSQPIIMGSWARGELCPRSDVDIVFSGPEADVKTIVTAIAELGIKLRYRTPEDELDWSVGVEDFDVIALLKARGLSSEAEEKLFHQQQIIHSNIKHWRKAWLKSMASDRKQRASRYDSISNYLEPNIKYGKGGLRDLEQSLLLFDVFPEKFVDRIDVKNKLLHYKNFLLNLRHYMHLHGLDEVIVAAEQEEMSKWLGYSLLKDFMKEVQWAVSEVSFYSDWTFERARTSEKLINIYRQKEVRKTTDAVEYLSQDTSRQAQEVVRNYLSTLNNKKENDANGRALKKYFSAWPEESFLRALFSSGLLAVFIPELGRIRGLVQHDQYHQYTVRAHLLQCMREVVRLRDRPKVLGALSKWVKKLSDNDWQILLWTALYHDLAKGRKGDHSTQGSQLVKKDFIKMKASLRQTVEVAWMVQNHLLLSKAAFRQDPNDPKNWQELQRKGVTGSRLWRLAVFTAIDIRGTNPESWTGWKGNLLNQLVDSVNSPKATRYIKLVELAQKNKVKLSPVFLDALDPSLVEIIPAKILLDDYKKIKTTKKQLVTMVWGERKGKLWVRFHRHKDESGIFLQFCNLLFAAGCQVQECFVQTIEGYGVYDWFSVTTNKSIKQLEKLTQIIQLDPNFKVPEVMFDRVSVSSFDEGQVVFSFRGKNKPGALLSASQALYDQGYDLLWARVYTWGRQIEDVFCVDIKSKNVDVGLSEIRRRLTK